MDLLHLNMMLQHFQSRLDMCIKILKISYFDQLSLDDASFVPLNYGLSDFKERGKWALQVTGLPIWQMNLSGN